MADAHRRARVAPKAGALQRLFLDQGSRCCSRIDLTLIRRPLQNHEVAGPPVAPLPRGPYALKETIGGEAVERSVGPVKV
jgi:hypothetical protein